MCDCNRTAEVRSRSNIASVFGAVSHFLTRSHLTLNVLLAGYYHPIRVGVAVLMVLTVSNLALWDDAWLAVKRDRTRRVKVFTMSGVQIGKPGVGESDERLTFPMRYLVGDALAGTPWVRFATLR